MADRDGGEEILKKDIQQEQNEADVPKEIVQQTEALIDEPKNNEQKEKEKEQEVPEYKEIDENWVKDAYGISEGSSGVEEVVGKIKSLSRKK